MSGWYRDVARPTPPLDGDMGSWLATCTGHSDPAIRELARAWAGRHDSPGASVETLAYATRGSWRSSAALERACVAWRVQTFPGAAQVPCSECHVEAGEPCVHPTGRHASGFHRDRRRRADEPIARAVRFDLRTIQTHRHNPNRITN